MDRNTKRGGKKILKNGKIEMARSSLNNQLIDTSGLVGKYLSLDVRSMGSNPTKIIGIFKQTVKIPDIYHILAPVSHQFIRTLSS